MEKDVRVSCEACQMLRCVEFKNDDNTKTIYGTDESIIFKHPEPVLQCEVLRGAITEEQFLTLLGWNTLLQALKEERD
jgi:hypothetical protein